MTKFIVLFLAIMCFTYKAESQTAMQISGVDCNGNNMDIFADLDAGKAVFLHFYMPDCGACPPVAQSIQSMANAIMIDFPEMIKGYAFPFQNSTTCDYSISWVNDNSLAMYAPMDSGALPVAYYGGFGMPTVVLLGGADHRVMFSTLSFDESNIDIMQDSILALFGVTTDIASNDLQDIAINVYPNPAKENVNLSFNTLSTGSVSIVVTDIQGNVVKVWMKDEVISENTTKQFSTNDIADGIYFVRLSMNENSTSQKMIIMH